MTALPWLPLLAPLALAAAGLAPAAWARRRPAAMGAVAQVAAALAVTVTLSGAAAVAVAGPLATGTLGAGGIGAGLYLDALSAIVALLVAAIGLVIVRASITYLQGEAGHGRFLRLLCRTLAAVLLLVVSGNLAQLALAWIAVSLALHPLLLFHPGRPAAVLAARKKFLVSRLGDACAIAAAVLLYRAAGTLDLAALLAAPPYSPSAAVLLAVAALLKSAQVPVHGWLLEVMETPTPVSALLHAGVISAGGFLILRFAGMVAQSPSALTLLAGIGAVTALFGAACMLPHSAVKTALAYSTIAQMGFMLLECGLGLFPAALLHIVAHALYKAHAFLASGSVLSQPPAQTAPGSLPGSALRVAVALLAGLAAWQAGLPDGAAALLAILLLGVGLWRGGAGPGLAVVALYALWQIVAAHLLAGALPVAEPLHDTAGRIAIAALVLAFAGVALGLNRLQSRPDSAFAGVLHAHLTNGWYLNTLANRLVLRLWPAPAPRAVQPDMPLLGRAGGAA